MDSTDIVHNVLQSEITPHSNYAFPDIKLQQFKTDFKGKLCYVTPRVALMPDGRGVMTMHLLNLYGSDVIYGTYMMHTDNKGKTWSSICRSKTLDRQKMSDGCELIFGDDNPIYHKKSGKILMLGHSTLYKDDRLAPDPRARYTVWTVYDPEKKDWEPFNTLRMPDEDKFFSCGSGGGNQCHELENGDLLIPVYFMSHEEAKNPWHASYSVTVMHCSFDGRELKLIQCGNSISIPDPRGFCEPSLIKFKDKFFVALRNDVKGYVASSNDGLTLDEPRVLIFDDGRESGNYCTQQHWFTLKDKLYMVYTRKGANNDHVFRHRAPLFMAEFDTEKMCLVRSTEKVAVPERGARLGNFGCVNISENEAWITVAEWMQTVGPDPSDWEVCMKYGSDNSIFIAMITAD